MTDCHDVLLLLRNWWFSSLPAILGVPGVGFLPKFHLFNFFTVDFVQRCVHTPAIVWRLFCPNCVVRAAQFSHSMKEAFLLSLVGSTKKFNASGLSHQIQRKRRNLGIMENFELGGMFQVHLF